MLVQLRYKQIFHEIVMENALFDSFECLHRLSHEIFMDSKTWISKSFKDCEKNS